jgi:hypothetical protein
MPVGITAELGDVYAAQARNQIANDFWLTSHDPFQLPSPLPFDLRNKN